ncbi:MAG: hypothetical protein ACJ71W_06030 [Terriglobales bacterium]
MRTWAIALLVALSVITLILVGGPSSPEPVYAQGGQMTGITWSGQVMTAKTTTGPTSKFPNYGFSSHWLTYCTTNATSLNIELEGSDDGATWNQISEQGATSTGCGIIETGGYYPLVRANILALTGTGATVNAWYHGSVFAIPAGGIAKGGKYAQPVTYVPSFAYTNSALSSTLQTVSSSAGAVYGGYVHNPSASIVYLVIQDGSQTLNQSQIIVPMTASFTGPIQLPTIGVGFATNIQAACTTSLSSLTAPGSACIVNLYFKGSASTNAVVNLGGTSTVVTTQTAPPTDSSTPPPNLKARPLVY